MIITDHWVEDIKRVVTSKHNRDITPRILVMHYTCGWRTSGDLATLTGANTPVSCHLLLSREGEWTQMVPFNRRAWHAGPSFYKGYTDVNSHSIGIEISNIGWVKQIGIDTYQDPYGNVIKRDPGEFDQHTMRSRYVIGKSARRADSDLNEWPVIPHARLAKGVYLWEPFYEAQLKALDQMVPLLLQTYPTIRHIVSHEEIDTRKWKTDPGPAFPMERYRALLIDEKGEPEQYRVTTDSLNVRRGPGMLWDTFAKLNRGDMVTEVATQGEWMHVRFGVGDTDGWVASRYLQEL